MGDCPSLTATSPACGRKMSEAPVSPDDRTFLSWQRTFSPSKVAQQHSE